ncbi:MAG TPA: hypothetical protein VK815_11840 [Candidatus Acidoferrales bacterium]|jgi:hypothetical protein|nr:hypothetical protein [Candidatus Acidoferrales bacterium]
MSLINDALKQARQTPPRNTPNSMPPLQPAQNHQESSPTAVWLVPAIIIFLVFAAIFFIGWAAAHRTVRTVAAAPADPDTTEQPETVAGPIAVSSPPPPPPVAPTPPAPKPKLQGIFYSPTEASAILDGKTIHTGDQFKQYKVKEISKYTVTLIDADKKEITIGMGD